MSYLVDVLSARFVPQVWRTELMNQLSTHVILDPIGCLDSATDNRLSFGGQRSIQRILDAAVSRQRSVVAFIAMRGSRFISRRVGLSAVTPIATEFCGAAK
jgi:hypothetical protein